MSEFTRVKAVEITFNEENRTINIKDFPVEEWSNIMTCASLYSTLSIRECRIERQMNPQNSTIENLKWVEARRRRMQTIDNKYKVAVGLKPSLYLNEADDAALEEWVKVQLDYEKLLVSQGNVEMSAPGRPYLHVYRARLQMLALMQLVAYASQTILGLCRQNHHNSPEFAIEKLKLMPKLIKEIIKHIQKFETEYASIKPSVDKAQPIEKSFGTF